MFVLVLDERCCDPLKLNCESKNILLYIQVGSERLSICPKCWSEIADSAIEWSKEGLDNEELQE